MLLSSPPAFFAVLSSYYDSFNSGMPESNDASYFSASNSSPPFSSPNRPADRAKVQTLLHAIVAITINFVDGGNHGRAGPAAAFARGEGRKQEVRVASAASGRFWLIICVAVKEHRLRSSHHGGY